MRHVFVINPAAGKNSPAKLLIPAIRAAFFERSDEFEIYETKGHRDAIAFVKGLCAGHSGPLRFYACGGDGTVNEVVNAIVDFPHASFGVVPCGSGNDFVKNLPDNIDFMNIEAQIAGQEQPVDLIKVNDRYCVNVSNVGFDAEVASNMDRFKALPLVSGTLAYNLALVYCFFAKMGNQMKIVVDDSKTLASEFLLMLAANGSFYGGGYKGAPLAEINDGLMDLCAVKKMPRTQMAKLLTAYKAGKHVSDPGFNKIVDYYKCKRIEVFSNQPVCLCIDGECFYDTHIVFEVAPSRVQFSVPAQMAGLPKTAEEQLAKAQN